MSTIISNDLALRLLKVLEEMDQTSEHEFGDCRSVEAVVTSGDMCDEYYELWKSLEQKETKDFVIIDRVLGELKELCRGEQAELKKLKNQNKALSRIASEESERNRRLIHTLRKFEDELSSNREITGILLVVTLVLVFTFICIVF